MKPRRFFFRCTPLFEAPLRYGVPVFAGLVALVTGLDAHAGDILRGGAGATAGPTRSGAGGGGAPTPAATAAARANARDTLARTTRTLSAMRAMQKAARHAAVRGPNHLGKTPGNPTVPLPTVPNGLGIGGLRVSTAANLDPSKWQGAVRPKQSTVNGRTKVTIKQTESQANLHWDTFNVGKNTTLTFDQSKGGENAGQWIAFNHVHDPSGNPSQILGSIQARGQVYIINRNGIIFGGSSQVNARGLTVSSLPINTNLVKQGLLNNRDAQFLFSGLKVPGGSDGTPDFTPEGPPASGQYGDVTVQRGAVLRSPGGDSGNGGRIMLVGSNVINAGTISTGSGQTILAAGSQVGIAAHDGGDPSLRGLDVWIGLVADHAGTATNSGIIETLTGSTLITGKTVRQLGAIESSTSVNLNGRIDLIASYSAVANPNFDNAGEVGFGAPRFLYEKNGTVTLGSKSTSRILPDYASADEVAGTSLPEASQIHIDGLAIHLAAGSDVFAPNADITVRAGTRTYTDADGNRTIFDADGKPEAGLTNHYTGSNQKFLFSGGSIHLDRSANLSVAGSVDVFVPTEQNLLDIELRGAELADSPLQRESGIRGAAMTVDIRKSGSHDGRFWQGTPLGDVTGLAGLIRRNAAQLTASGGNISMSAGDSIVMRSGSNVDVSGGFFLNEGGNLNTSSLVSNGRLISIEDATPDRQYDSVFNGETTFFNPKWGIIETYATPLFSSAVQSDYVSGAAGGTLTLSAPSMALDGNLRGTTIRGNQQRSAPPEGSTLNISFLGERAVQVPGSVTVSYINFSPTPPEVRFAAKPPRGDSPVFQLVNGEPVALAKSRLDTVTLAQSLLDEDGFGSLAITNPDGDIIVPRGTHLRTESGGSITLKAANITIGGSLVSPSGSISLTTYNISPSFTAEYGIINPPGTVPFPDASTDRGFLHLTGSGRIHTAGLISNDLPYSSAPFGEPISVSGGAITLRSYNTRLAAGSVLNVSGGVHVNEKAAVNYGDGGSITIVSGTDDGFPGLIGGDLSLASQLLGYSGAKGASLAIQASTIRIGNAPSNGDLTLESGFFRKGGFTNYSLSAIGARSTANPPNGQFESYLPAITLNGAARLRPVAESLMAKTNTATGEILVERVLQDEWMRTPTSLSFTTIGSDDTFTIDSLEVRGDFLMRAGSSIRTDTGASVSIKGETVTVLGKIEVPGGSISISGDSSFPFTDEQELRVTQALPTVHFGPNSRLLAKGALVGIPDYYGRRSGTLFDGGSITISGNIVAEKGGVMNVSGSTTNLDLSASERSGDISLIARHRNGLFATPVSNQGFETRVDSNGGSITLAGSQTLLSDATLIGRSGGESASAGLLSISSQRYYAQDAGLITSADTNFIVKQTGDVIRTPHSRIGIGLGLKDTSGEPYGNLGEFSLARFHEGGFADLSLAGNYDPAGSVPVGGNILFEGDINLRVPGSLRMAAGGVITGEGAISIRAAYASIGQDFRAPHNPRDSFQPFQKLPAFPTSIHTFQPVHGSGNVSLTAGFIDVGVLSFQNIGNVSLDAGSGDIRGNSTVQVAGNLSLNAATIYPTTGSTFSLFAYDHDGGTGSIGISSPHEGGVPLSAGGSIEVFASTIYQRGVLRAPGGKITLGWDGHDLDPSTTEFDSPYNLIAGTTATPPVTASLGIGSRSLTSVSSHAEDNSNFRIPYGISPDGRSWIAPDGTNISLNSLTSKQVTLASDSVNMRPGARVSLVGGGDLLASRWISGNGGSVDLLGSATASWDSGASYDAGDLVTYSGKTWSARVSHNGVTPSVSTYWTQVAESYAIIPTANLPYAPFARFNTGSNAGHLDGDPGFVDNSLRIGDTVTLDQGSGIPAGTYTLLPRRYALLPNAWLVTPVSSSGIGAIGKSDGSTFVTGYMGNRFRKPDKGQANRTRFEVAPPKVFSQRAEYDTFLANRLLASLAEDAGITAQRLPNDAGSAVISGNSALHLAGTLQTLSPGLGATLDISSDADIHLRAGTDSMPIPGAVSLTSAKISSWNIESLLIGGIRQTLPDGTVSVDVRSNNITVNNAGSPLKGTDITLVSNQSLTLSDKASILALGTPSFAAPELNFQGNGSIVRLSQNPEATILRDGVTANGGANLVVGKLARISGKNVILDSTNAMSLSSTVRFNTDGLTIGAGGIAIRVNETSGGPDPSAGILSLGGATLDNLFNSQDIRLRSYSSIDFHGKGTIGGNTLHNLTLSSSSLRGMELMGGAVSLVADTLTLDNILGSDLSTGPSGPSGNFIVKADNIYIGENSVTITGFKNVALNASRRISGTSNGSLEIIGSLSAETPLITGESGSNTSILSSGAIALTGSGSTPGTASSLGARISLTGFSIHADTNITAPSGDIILTATTGDTTVDGVLSSNGASKRFADAVRFTNAGSIKLAALNGDVILGRDARVSVIGNHRGGNAGTISINASNGEFRSQAELLGGASEGYTTGSFAFDAGTIPGTGTGSLSFLNSALDVGDFNNSRGFRIRNGDILIDHRITVSDFSLSADNGSVRVTDTLDASGLTGGSISLIARNDLTIASGAILTVAGSRFDNAGKGGSISLESGASQNGSPNEGAMLTLEDGATLDLSVAEWVSGAYDSPGSSAFEGRFTGTLHLRAPRTNGGTDLGIASLQSRIIGASSVIAEGYKVYQPAGGVMNTALRNGIDSDNKAFLGTAGTPSTHETAIRSRLLAGNPTPGALASALVVAPGVEIINLNGDLTLGQANINGSTSAEARHTADWDLSSFRYGENGAPGILTMRASGDLVFNNTLSDGFDPVVLQPFFRLSEAGDSLMWMGTLSSINPDLPVNTQSWSYRLTAGADLGASDYRSVQAFDAPGTKGSLLLGEFYPAVPNSSAFGAAPAVGTNGLTANTIRISTNASDRGTRFEVIRTGTGSISIHAGRDIQIRNQFASIYTAGVAIPDPTRIFEANDFVVPVIPESRFQNPSQTGTGGIQLGVAQQLYQPVWSMAGGNIDITATGDIAHVTSRFGQIIDDSSRQMPTNWLYRRGFVDPATGLFSDNGGFGNVLDVAASTAWWIDYSNFFQNIGTLGGGNLSLAAGKDVSNIDAVAPTNARMAGRRRNPDFGTVPGAPEYINLAPGRANLLEYGGGDITITAGNDIDGGIYYAERGTGSLFAGGDITTNSTRSPSLTLLTGAKALDSRTWLPTTLFVGKSHFDVTARGSVLLGPVANPFILPQGINNRFWHKTYFNTFSDNSGATVAAYGGDVTHRNAVTLAGASAQPILNAWFTTQNLFTGTGSFLRASQYQPWLRLAETGLGTFGEVFKLNAPNLSSTSFVGGINLVGSHTFAPSKTGNLELAAATGITGLNSTGTSAIQGITATIWTSANINVSDASPSSIPGTTTPLAYQSLTGPDRQAMVDSLINVLQGTNLALNETGSYSGRNATPLVQQSLHGDSLLHAGDANPVTLTALDGDITGLTLFSPKKARITAQRDITDVAFYIQNVDPEDISLVSAGRDLIPFQESSELRNIATNLDAGNIIGDSTSSTTSGTSTNARAGDIQISGPGVIEALAGGNIDLGTGANFTDGTGTGITSIGNNRNPNLPFTGADLVVLSGISSAGSTAPAGGLSRSNLDFASFIDGYLDDPSSLNSLYLEKIGRQGDFDNLSAEHQAVAAFEEFFEVLRQSGRTAGRTGDYSAGFKAMETLFGNTHPKGDIDLRSREIRTSTGGAISIAVRGAGIRMAAESFGNPLTPPGIVTEYGGPISTFTHLDVDIGQSRIFTLRGGDIVMWSSQGNIAAGSAPRTVVTAPPTRVVVNVTSANVETDLGGLATGGGIGVLAAVEDVDPGNVDLIAPNGFVDAGDAGIRVTGNLNIAAQVVLNSSNISAAGATTGSAVSAPAAPSVAAVTNASNTSAAASATANQTREENAESNEIVKEETETPSVFTVEVIGYGGGSGADEDEEDDDPTQQSE